MTTNTKIRIVLVEDSDVQRDVLVQLIDLDPDMRVIGVAKNGVEAIEVLKQIKPDLVLMDLHMPKMNGVETIRHLMRDNPLPIVAISASDQIESVGCYDALEAGALAFVEKPIAKKHPRYPFLCELLLKTIKLMSQVKVVRRREISKIKHPSFEIPQKNKLAALTREIKMIAVGASTGGPVVLKTILSGLPESFAPIIIVQHIAPGFIQGLAKWLSQTTNHRVEIASHARLLERNCVYLAPDNHQIGVLGNGYIFLRDKSQSNEICPSINFLFNSVAEMMEHESIGILLTGMGNDGAEGLKKMRDSGAITIAQDEKSSLIYGMPRQAVLLNAAGFVLTPEEIIEVIRLTQR
jgi:two-component system chemotaxis response regulator CheB